MKFKIINSLYEERYSLKSKERIENYYVPPLLKILKEIKQEQRTGYGGYSSRYNDVNVIIMSKPKIFYTISGVEFAPKTSSEEKREGDVFKFDVNTIGTDLRIKLSAYKSAESKLNPSINDWIPGETVSMKSFLLGGCEVGEVYANGNNLDKRTEEFKELISLYKESIQSVENENNIRSMSPEEKSLYQVRKKMAETTYFSVDDELYDWIEEHVMHSKVYIRKGLVKDLDKYFPGITSDQYGLWEDDHYSWTAQFDFDTIEGCPNEEIRQLYVQGKGKVYSINLGLALYNERGFKFGRRYFKRDLKK